MSVFTQRNEIAIISAFAANPDMSSETGIGWLFIKVAGFVGRKHGFHVIALMNCRSAERVTREVKLLGLEKNISAIGVPLPKPFKFLERNPRLTRLEYLVWWLCARRKALSLSAQFDVIFAQHVTFATEMFPTPVSALPPTTYRVWGPVGASGDGSVYDIPPVTAYALRERRVQRVRDRLATVAAKVHSRGIDWVYAQNESVEETFRSLGRSVETFPNVVISDALQAEISRLEPVVPETGTAGSIKILAVGHLIPRKRFEIAIAAMADPRLAEAQLLIAGAPLPGTPSYLPEIAENFGVSDRVLFLGKVARNDVLGFMNSCDVLMHPSAREGASGVVGEATAVGIPTVCFEKTGAASVLRASGGSGVTLVADNADVEAVAAAILRAAELPRIKSNVWTESRFESLIESVYLKASARNSVAG